MWRYDNDIIYKGDNDEMVSRLNMYQLSHKAQGKQFEKKNYKTMRWF